MRMEYVIIENIEKKLALQQKDTDKNVIRITHTSPIKILKSKFENCTINGNNKFLSSTSKGKITINDKVFKIEIKEYAKRKLHYLSIESRNKYKDLEDLTILDDEINKSMKDNFIVITSYDSISEYYCNEMYSRLNKFERKLRLLLFNVYTFAYGYNYSEKLVNKIGKEQYRKDKDISTESNNIELLKQFLYSLDYNSIIDLLFTAKWTAEDEENKNKILEKIRDNDINIDQNNIESIIDNVTPKNDWDKLFLPRFGLESIKDSMDRLRELRNKVAHCKFFRKNSYEECNSLLDELETQIDKAIKIITSEDFEKLNMEYLGESATEALKKFAEAMQTIGKVISDSFSKYTLPAIQNLSKSIGTLALSSLNRSLTENKENVEED